MNFLNAQVFMTYMLLSAFTPKCLGYYVQHFPYYHSNFEVCNSKRKRKLSNTVHTKYTCFQFQELRKYPTTQRPLPFQKICTWRIIGTILRNQASIGGYFQRMRPIPIKCFPKSASAMPSDQEKFEKTCKEIKAKPDDQKSMNDLVLEQLCIKSGWEPTRG